MDVPHRRQKNLKMVVVGIDPGFLGGFAVLRPSGVSVFDTEDFVVSEKKGKKNHREYHPIEMAETFRGAVQRSSYQEDFRIVIGLEAVHAMPHQGTTSTFSFGKGFGIWLGILGAEGHAVELITPQRWKKHFHLIGQPKDAARLLAKKLFPTIDLSVKKYVGRADALLIAQYMKETLGSL